MTANEFVSFVHCHRNSNEFVSFVHCHRNSQGDRMEAVWAQAMLPFIGSMVGTAAGVAGGTAAGGFVTKHPWGAMGGGLIVGIAGNYVGEGIGQEAADAISGRAGGGGC